MKLHKLEVYVFNFEGLSEEDLKAYIEEINTHTQCYFTVKKLETTDVTDYDDDHELNKRGTSIESFRGYFK